MLFFNSKKEKMKRTLNALLILGCIAILLGETLAGSELTKVPMSKTKKATKGIAAVAAMLKKAMDIYSSSGKKEVHFSVGLFDLDYVYSMNNPTWSLNDYEYVDYQAEIPEACPHTLQSGSEYSFQMYYNPSDSRDTQVCCVYNDISRRNVLPEIRVCLIYSNNEVRIRPQLEIGDAISSAYVYDSKINWKSQFNQRKHIEERILLVMPAVASCKVIE
tara:strand:- start:1137 stop:1790 length:654 start_codon:yes stop_codon:yes gene_type:complete